jgi:hypothetical protein
MTLKPTAKLEYPLKVPLLTVPDVPRESMAPPTDGHSSVRGILGFRGVEDRTRRGMTIFFGKGRRRILARFPSYHH